MKKLILISLILLTLNSCSYYVYPPKVKISYKYEYNYKPKIIKDWETSKWRKSKTIIEYIKYDKNGNKTEIGEYGERWSKTVSRKNSDSLVEVTTYCGAYPKRLNTVTYKSYNDSNNVLSEEVWLFKNNKKDHLSYKTFYTYSNGKLTKESEFDKNGKLVREKEYGQNVIKGNIPKTIYKPFVLIKGSNNDSIRYDTSGRVIEDIHYYNGKFWYRQEFRYYDYGTIKTELRYNDKPDSLWCITEWRYDLITKQISRKYWKVINSNSERREEYIYNRKKLLKRVERYNIGGKTGYTKFKYKLY